jgi:hypothetical protein
MRAFVTKYSGGKTVLAFFVLANLLYLLMLFLTIPQVMVYARGMKLFDMMPTGYDPGYATAFLDTLGPAGRSVYLTHQLPVDLLYPLFSALAYCLLMAWLFKKLNLFEKPVFYLCLLPLVAGLFDYLENFGIITMILKYPEVSPVLVSTVSGFTLIKSMLSALFFIILILAFAIFLIKQILTALTSKKTP